MKKLTLILLLFLCFSCDDSQVLSKNKIISQDSNRIKLIEKTYMVSRGFFIIEVDKHLYLSCSDGGFTHMESCPCKK